MQVIEIDAIRREPAQAFVAAQRDLVRPAVDAAAEAEIRRRNRSRPLPYENQLPSMIPNSISI